MTDSVPLSEQCSRNLLRCRALERKFEAESSIHGKDTAILTERRQDLDGKMVPLGADTEVVAQLGRVGHHYTVFSRPVQVFGYTTDTQANKRSNKCCNPQRLSQPADLWAQTAEHGTEAAGKGCSETKAGLGGRSRQSDAGFARSCRIPENGLLELCLLFYVLKRWPEMPMAFWALKIHELAGRLAALFTRRHMPGPLPADV